MIPTRARLVFVSLAVGAGWSLAGICNAETYHVDPNGSDSATGTGWLSNADPSKRPFKTLTKALAAAAGNQEPDLIKVAKGTYLASSTGDETASFALVDDCVIQGGYEGSTTNPDLRLPANYALTILSGDLSGNYAGSAFDPSRTADNSDRIVLASGVLPTAVLEGFTIINGCGTDATVPLDSALDCWDGQVPAKEGGAAIDCIQGSPAIRFCTFRHNWSRLGGAVRLLCESDPQIVGCVFDDNWAYQSVPSIPAVFGSGGGLYMQAYCDPFVFNCTFKENRAFHIGGGCAAQNEAVPTFLSCLFLDNDCEELGGGYRSGFEAVSTLINCTFRGNTAATGGGISVNRVDPPGGIDVTLRNCLIWGNEASVAGDEVFVQNSPPGTLKAWNCDIQAAPGDISGAIIWATPNINADPLYGADSRPAFTSLCLNQGDASLDLLIADPGDVDDDNDFSEALPLDVSGAQRRVFPATRIDVGALENELDSCFGDIAPNLNGGPDGIVDGADMGTLLGRWGTPGGVADLSPAAGDGVVDAQDLVTLLGLFGPCNAQGMMMSGSSIESGTPSSPAEVAAQMGFASIDDFVAWLESLGLEAMTALLQALFPD
jgi:hypothetical protein